MQITHDYKNIWLNNEMIMQDVATIFTTARIQQMIKKFEYIIKIIYNQFIKLIMKQFANFFFPSILLLFGIKCFYKT